MKKIVRGLLVLAFVGASSAAFAGKIGPKCTFKGHKLYGKIEFVNDFPDLKVEFVNDFPDLKVKMVDDFPDKCGEWKVVHDFPDLKVEVVHDFPDLKVKIVHDFPGLP